MISERQARALLAICEERMRRPLTQLRQRLQRDDPRPDLWELLVLDAALAAEQHVEHEPHPGCPDIVLGGPDERRMFIECAWITPSQSATRARVQEFVDWVRRELRARHPGLHVNMRLEAANKAAPVTAPPEHEWRNIRQSAKWEAFAGAIGKEPSPSLVLAESCNLEIIVEVKESGRSVFTSGPIFNTPSHPEDHPVYRIIRNKAEQAAQWQEQGGVYDPLVLVVGADEGLEYIDPLGCGAVTLKQAVYSALLHEDAHPLTRYNSAGSWRPRKPRKRPPGAPFKFEMCGPRVRVKQSYLISAVVVVLFKSEFEFLGGGLRRRPSLKAFLNEDPRVTLDAAHVARLQRCLDFNRVEYTCADEAWEHEAAKGETLPASRARHCGGRLVIRGIPMVEVEVPAVLLHQILAGTLTASDAWKGFRTDIPARLKEALNEGREIIDVKYISASPLSRDEPRVLLKFGPPQHPLIRVGRRLRKDG